MNIDSLHAYAHPVEERRTFSMGDVGLDARLGRGMEASGLHEIYAEGSLDAAAATGFALMLVMRCCSPEDRILWLRREQAGNRPKQALYAPGLADLGFDTRQIVLVHAGEAVALLRTATDVVRCPAVGGMILELGSDSGKLDLTGSRRFHLAARQSSMLAIVVRYGNDLCPSAAQTRWRVASAPSLPLEADAPGFTTLDISLLRHREGVAPFAMRVMWNGDERRFVEVPHNPQRQRSTGPTRLTMSLYEWRSASLPAALERAKDSDK